MQLIKPFLAAILLSAWIAQAQAQLVQGDASAVRSDQVQKSENRGSPNSLSRQQQDFLTPATASLLAALLTITASLVGIGLTSWWRARIDFELKAAEIVLTSKYPQMASRRASILRELFPGRLSKSFATQFDVGEFPGVLKYEMTLELFKAISSKLETKAEVEAAWLELFPPVSWGKTRANYPAKFDPQGSATCTASVA